MSPPPPGPVVGAAPGSVALQDLAGGSVTGVRAGTVPTIYNFVQPGTAAPGSPLWLTLRLHLAGDFASAANGQWLLSASTAGYTAAQVTLTADHGRVSVDALGLVTGHQQETLPGQHLNLDFENYLQNKAVRPGPSDLTLTLRPQQAGGIGLTQVTLLPDSALTATTVRYDEIGLQAPVRPIVVAAGQTATVPYRLIHRGGRPDGPTAVALHLRNDSLHLRGQDRQDYPAIGDGRYGTFQLQPEQPGTYQIQLEVPNRYNQAAALVTIIVTSPARRHLNPVALGLLIGLFLLAVTVFIRRRRRGSSSG